LKIIKKCLFPAAGYGTRFLPATKTVPKEMLPIITKPLLQFGVEEAISAGINNMAIVTGRGKRAIEDYFDNAFELESELANKYKTDYLKEVNKIIESTTFTFVRQKKMLGLGNAILCGQPLIGNEPFSVILADDLCVSNNDGLMSQMIKIYNEYKCSIIAIEEVPISETNKYGIIDGSLINNSKNIYQVSDMVEKPECNNAPSNMAIVGRYILTPDIFNILERSSPDKNGEFQITDALKILAMEGKVLAYKFKGSRFDCGSVSGYLKAINHFSKNLDID